MKRAVECFCLLLYLNPFLSVYGCSLPESSGLLALLPEVPGWELAEEPQLYHPDTLFEYIDGAAESYLSYDFRELVVAQYRKAGAPASLTLEIYHMGEAKNAFGIYSAERYPESRFLKIGAQGYQEEGTLNFILGDKYVKLLCFEAGEETERTLQLFARTVEAAAGEKGSLPAPLQYFPPEGIVANSEKFILRNFLGYSFLHDGFSATYRVDGQEFELFLIEGENEEDAAAMLEQYLSGLAKRGQAVESVEGRWHTRDRYAQNVYLTRIENYILGVMRIGDGYEELGLRYLNLFVESLKK